MNDYYAVLGVEPDASPAAMKAAYRRRAQLLHPDKHAHLSGEVHAEAERAMAELNEAWDVLSDERRRAAYDASRRGDQNGVEERPQTSGRAPNHSECMLCGSGPATEIHLERCVGMLVTRRKWTADLRLCRSCGLAAFRSEMNQTLIKGWWGVLSFFANLAAIWNNYMQWQKINKLGPPVRAADVTAPMTRPMPPGPPLTQRAGIWVVAAMVGLVAFGGVLDSTSPSPSRAPTTTNVAPAGGGGGAPAVGGRDPQPEDLVGYCIDFTSTGRVRDVNDCSGMWDSKVIAVRTSDSLCPAYRTDSYLELSYNEVLCLDDRY